MKKNFYVKPVVGVYKMECSVLMVGSNDGNGINISSGTTGDNGIPSGEAKINDAWDYDEEW